MVTELSRTAPAVSPQLVIATGATQIRNVFPSDQIGGIVLAYMAGIKVSFALVVGLAGITCLLGIFVPRKRLNVESLQAGVA